MKPSFFHFRLIAVLFLLVSTQVHAGLAPEEISGQSDLQRRKEYGDFVEWYQRNKSPNELVKIFKADKQISQELTGLTPAQLSQVGEKIALGCELVVNAQTSIGPMTATAGPYPAGTISMNDAHAIATAIAQRMCPAGQGTLTSYDIKAIR
jgi:hypothetical protein